MFALGPDRIITDGSALPSLMESAFAAFMETRGRLAATSAARAAPVAKPSGSASS